MNKNQSHSNSKRSLLLLLTMVFSLFCLHAQGKQTESRTLVNIQTNMGNIVVALYNETPLHRDNFIKLCEKHYYDSLLFHRVIENFMIQGGDPESRNAIMSKQLGDGGPGYDIPAEIVYPQCFHKRGALAAARESDDVNPERQSSGSQFYIVWGKRQSKGELKELDKKRVAQGLDKIPESLKQYYMKNGGTPHLDSQYTVFGEVTEGLDIVEKIQKTRTLENDRPFDDVIILSTQVTKPN